MKQFQGQPSGSLSVTRLGASQDRLDSWKEIASYLKREVRTVQIWEKNEGLPVHRHFHRQLGTVYAFKSEIEAWGRKQTPDQSARTLKASHSDSAGSVASNWVLIDLHTLQEASAGDNLPPLHRTLAEIVSAFRRCDPATIRIADKNDKQHSHYRLLWSSNRAGDLTLQLFEGGATTDKWSLTIPLPLGHDADAFQVVGEKVARCLWLKLISHFATQAISRAGMTQKQSAREFYLRGRYFWNQRNGQCLRKAISCFRSAIADDPKFALPYSGLADSLTLLSFYELAPPSKLMPEARAAAMKALQLDSDRAECHASLADIYMHFDRDWELADASYRRAIECDPGYALGYHWYSNLLSARGNHEAAHIAIMQALAIDPVSLITQVWAGVTCHLARRFDDAIKHYLSALELGPDFAPAHMYLAQALEQTGRFSDALGAFDTTMLLSGSNSVTAMKAHAYAVSGDHSAAKQILKSLITQSSQVCMPSYDIAAAYAALGDRNQTVDWLKRACFERNMNLFKVRQDPRFDPLRSCTEFRDVIAQIGLPDQHSKASSILR